MKPINEIIKTDEFRNQLFKAALCEFACKPEDGPALYYDSFVSAAIIYHLRHSKRLRNAGIDEVSLLNLKTFISNLQDVDDETIDLLNDIYNRYRLVAEKYQFDEKIPFKSIYTSYECEYPMEVWMEMWENPEFKERFNQEKLIIVNELRPIQDLIREL